jgi:hypothetical protein
MLEDEKSDGVGVKNSNSKKKSIINSFWHSIYRANISRKKSLYYLFLKVLISFLD